MDLYSFLYQVFFYPIQLTFEFIYSIIIRMIPFPGVAIVTFSIIMNILLIPIKEKTGQIQKEQKRQTGKLSYWKDRINNAFKGDERFFMLKTFYRQQGYNPIFVVKEAFPILLELPFFIAAYNFLSSLSQLDGISFGFIKDLSKPDALFNIAGMNINILPIVMTFISIISDFVYTKGGRIKDKIRLLALTLFFLVLLYNSPSALVIYWTINNLFSLLRSYFQKENKTKNVDIITNNSSSVNKCELLFCLLSNILLLGIVIPSSVIKSSPIEFVNTVTKQNPLIFLLGSLSLAIGFFGIWLPFFYLFIVNNKRKMYICLSVFSVVALIDHFFFATDLGYISEYLKYSRDLYYTLKEMLINIFVLFVVCVICIVLFKRFKNNYFNIVIFTVLLVIGIGNIFNISEAYDNSLIEEKQNDEISIPLSSNGKNVIVLMLDRAIGAYVPYIMNEKPELKEQFAGFTYYPFTRSFGGNTEMASAAVFGGYDYIYKGAESITTEKRNQALKLMPLLFSDNGFKVTIFDPPLANDQNIPDLSIYDDMNVEAYYGRDRLCYTYEDFNNEDRRYRNFFCYGVCRIMPLALQFMLYDDGHYNDVSIFSTDYIYNNFSFSDNISKGVSFNYRSEHEYAELDKLPDITSATDTDNTFFMAYNMLPHEPTILKEPSYELKSYVDNTDYDKEHENRFIVDGRKMRVENSDQMQHYQVNMASFILLGKWFDYLRQNNLYDNTRIIIVGDHGNALKQFDDFILDDGTDIEGENPLLMVKDFNSEDYSVDYSFMTNADVPVIALNNIIEAPVDPFTGNKIDSSFKKEKYNDINFFYRLQEGKIK